MADRVEHTAPEPGVTEIRVHGVGGANPSSMLGRTDIQQVTGDATAGFFRAVNPPETNRTVEAYSWGGLTAKSRSRAMWVLLVPFALVNLAGWMVEPIPGRKPEDGAAWPVRAVIWVANRLEKGQRSLVHATSLALTGAYVMWVALMSMNLLAYQCGTRPECAADRFYAEFLQGPFFVDQPGRRIVVGALVPLALLALFAIISIVSRSRYEAYTETESEEAGEAAESEDEPSAEDKPHVLTTEMEDAAFWYTSLWHTRLFRAHVAFALALLSGITSYASWQFVDSVPHGGTAGAVKPLAMLVGALTVLLAAATITFVVYSVWKEDRSFVKYGKRLNRYSKIVLRVALVLTAAALLIAWQLQGRDTVLPRNAISSDLWGFGWTPVLLFAAAVAFVLLFSLVEIAKWIVTCEIRPGLFFIAIAGVMILAWPYAWAVFLLAIFIAIPARYFELRLCSGEKLSKKRDWVEVGASTTALFALQLIGYWAWPKSAWGNEWPRLTPVVVTAAILFMFFRREVRNRRAEELAAGETRYTGISVNFPAVVAIVLAGVGVIVWLLIERIDALYLAAYASWMVISFFWVAIQDHDRFRWNGPGAVALLAVSLTAGLFSGGLIRFVSLLTRDGYQLRTIELYGWIAVGFVAISAGGVVALVAWLLFTRATHGEQAKRDILLKRSQIEAGGDKPAPKKIAGKVRNWTSLARGVEAIDVFIMHISMVTLYAAMALVLHFLRDGIGFGEFLDQPVPESWDGLVSVSAWVTLMIVLGAVLAVRSGLRDAGFRRQIGIIWDVTSFWPRHFHPFAPPSYAVRTVPELQNRLSEISGGGAAILSGHSQGSVVAFATAASVKQPIAEKLAVVTHGSPLARFYGRFFPKYFNDELIKSTARRVGPTGEIADGSWLNFHRPTDPIAQPIFRGGRRPTTVNPMPAIADILPTDRAGDLPDVPLDDPADLRWPHYQGPPDVLWHINYMSDPLMAKAIDTLTDVLEQGVDPPYVDRDSAW